MAYNRSIPQSTDLISNSQSQILGNFQAIDSGTTGTGAGFSRNHITLTDATNGGLHNRVDYYQSVTDPMITGFVSSLYAKTVVDAELFYRNLGGIVQLTNLAVTSSGNNYGFQTPWGITLNWGRVSNVGSGGSTSATLLTYQVPFTSTFGSIATTGLNSDGSNGNVTVSLTGTPLSTINLYSQNNNTVFYFAIGI